jgi:cytoskeletal protein CcmA (bactofilin family)
MDPKSEGKGKTTLVEEGTRLQGSLSSSCPIEVNGRFEGELAAPALEVNPGGAIAGKVKVGELASRGELAGDFDADVVQLSGTVKDKTVIRARSLTLQLTAPKGKMQLVFGESEGGASEERSSNEQRREEASGRRSPERPRKSSTRPPHGDAPS